MNKWVQFSWEYAEFDTDPDVRYKSVALMLAHMTRTVN